MDDNAIYNKYERRSSVISIISNSPNLSEKANGNHNNNWGITLSPSCDSSRIEISRKPVRYSDLSRRFGKRKSIKAQSKFKEKVIYKAKKYRNQCTFFNWLESWFPIVSWIRHYSIKNYLINDLIAGFTLAVLHIPQGMAYGTLAGLRPEHGLYVSFFPVIIYALMGTSFHISIGTFSLVSIMVSEAAQNVYQNTISNYTYNEPPYFESYADGYGEADTETQLEILTSLCLLCGIIQLVMGFLHLGTLSVLFSETIVSSLETAAAFHVVTIQVPYLFSIKPPKVKSRPLKLIKEWINIFTYLKDANFVTLGISVFSLILLYTVKEYFEPKIKKRWPFRIPIPIDLILVIGATCLSWGIDLYSTQKVDIVGSIPLGLPMPRMPKLKYFPDLIMDAFVISIFVFGIAQTLALTFAKKYRYQIDHNQELLALGSSNFFSSFFSCYPVSPALSRCSVMFITGGKTQIACLISSVFILIVLLFLGQLLYHLPNCVFASIIIVALIPVFAHGVHEFKHSFQCSKIEGLSWVITFLAVILLDVDLGLLVGIAWALFLVLLRLSIPNSVILGQLPDSEIYANVKVYSQATEIHGIKIFHFNCALFFLNCRIFKEKLYKKVFDIYRSDEDRYKKAEEMAGKIHTIIIDCSSMFYIDSAGVETIEEVIQEFKTININVALASCNEKVMSTFERTHFLDDVSESNKLVFGSVHDAVVCSSSNDISTDLTIKSDLYLDITHI